jgi:hypothetical protein
MKLILDLLYPYIDDVDEGSIMLNINKNDVDAYNKYVLFFIKNPFMENVFNDYLNYDIDDITADLYFDGVYFLGDIPFRFIEFDNSNYDKRRITIDFDNKKIII